MNGLLIVDDEEGVRRALQKALSKENYQIYQAGDGNEAIGVVRDKPCRRWPPSAASILILRASC